jgi:hypothetical protein
MEKNKYWRWFFKSVSFRPRKASVPTGNKYRSGRGKASVPTGMNIVQAAEGKRPDREKDINKRIAVNNFDYLAV